MELRDIEYFAVVAEHGHLARAAESLQLSQPALSKSLRRLERGIGAKLVRRSPKGVELTAAGNALLSQIGRLRLALADVARQVQDIGRGRAGILRVAANQFSIDFLLPGVLSVLVEHAPGITLRLTSGGSDITLPSLRSGRCDVAIGFFSELPVGIASEVLMVDEFVPYASVRHRLAKARHLTIGDVASERWVLGPANVPDWQWIYDSFQQGGLAAPHAAIETSATLLRLEAVARSLLLGFAPRRFVLRAARHLGLVELPVNGLAWPCRLEVRYRRDGYLSPAARRFIDILKGTASKVGAGKP